MSDLDSLLDELDEMKQAMLGQVKWEQCDCGCPTKRKPADVASVTWLRAVQRLEIARGKWNEKRHNKP